MAAEDVMEERIGLRRSPWVMQVVVMLRDEAVPTLMGLSALTSQEPHAQ